MPRISKCDKLSEHDRLKLVGRIGQGATWRDLETEFGIPFGTIREWAERNGYSRRAIEQLDQEADDGR